jgi:hypothetical protein
MKNKLRKNKNVTKLFIVLLMLNVVSTTVPVHAFELLGGQYSSTDISDMDYKVSPYADHKTQIQNAASPAGTSWEDIVDSDTPDWIEVTSGTYEVYISDYDDAYGYLGWTYNDPSTGTTDSSIIWINDWYIDQSYYTDSNHFQWLLAHEMGHVQGLAHESDFGPTVLMYPYDATYTSNGIYTPQSDDEDGIEDLYG